MSNPEFQSLVAACIQGSHDGSLHFGQIVQRLAAGGVESYHADYRREETTYYHENGESLVYPHPLPDDPIAEHFDAAAVAAAVKMAQAGGPEYSYAHFVRLTRAAGCIGYFVWIAGRRVDYLGRRGECHVEHFPGTPSQEKKMASIGLSIDVPNLADGIRFYTDAFGFSKMSEPVPGVAALSLDGMTVYLLEKKEGSRPSPKTKDLRHYERHWTPVHMDVHVDNLALARERAVQAGAIVEQVFEDPEHGSAAFCGDPFGHGFCLIEQKS